MSLSRDHARLTSAASLCLPGTLAALVLMLGCSYPKAIDTYEFLDQYDHMTDRFDPVISLVYLDPAADISRYRNFIVGNVAVGRHWVEDQKAAQSYATLFRNLMARELVEANRFDYVILDPSFRHRSPMLRMEAMVTIFDTGSGVCRFFSYFLFPLQKPGATDLQIEGRLYDTATGEVVMEFVDRRRHLGNTPWGPTPATFRDEFVMKQTVLETARALALFISRAHEGTLPQPDEPSPQGQEAAE